MNTDVLIIGAGPTGLMMACQLTRFGIPFRIIDKQADRSKESRAFAIQAKSMEIFQNLGIASEFIEKEIAIKEVSFYVHGKSKFHLNFKNIDAKGTPFPSVFFLPQSATEEILIDFLTKKNVSIERQTELLSFSEVNDRVEAEIKNNVTGLNEKITCQYIVGCDGSHSVVREVLGTPFVGASYEQEFVLADLSVQWNLPRDTFTAFMNRKGNVLFFPLDRVNNLYRVILIGMGGSPTLQEIETFTKNITGMDITLSNPIWISSFYLHHRAVQQYQKGRAFIAGDAAHIHSPVGGQGMNTGFQDVTNLAWKLAFVLKYHSPKELIETYQTERKRIGQILVNTTDKIFGLITNKNFIVSTLRLYVMPFVMSFLTKSVKFNQRLFHFISQLGVRYHDNPFIEGPDAGRRAPDAPVNSTTLFELFRKKPVNILIFYDKTNPEFESKIQEIEKINPDIIAVHSFIKSPETSLIFTRYGMKSSGVCLVRPDGYIGFRSFENPIDSLLIYLKALFLTE